MCAEKYAPWSFIYHSFIVYLIPEPQCSQVFEEGAEESEQMTTLSHSWVCPALLSNFRTIEVLQKAELSQCVVSSCHCTSALILCLL